MHKAVAVDKDGTRRTVAVKILRPGVERSFKRDLDSYRFAAGLIERFHAPSRRLMPLAVVENLRRTTELEMDLRLEAAAISEIADNIKGDTGFRVPSGRLAAHRAARLTIEWIDGTPSRTSPSSVPTAMTLKALGMTVLRSFLRHAMRDGFFHGDMHQGNLFVDAKGDVVAVDFGIVGRIGRRSAASSRKSSTA